jgi:hypothetical protein
MNVLMVDVGGTNVKVGRLRPVRQRVRYFMANPSQRGAHLTRAA